MLFGFKWLWNGVLIVGVMVVKYMFVVVDGG